MSDAARGILKRSACACAAVLGLLVTATGSSLAGTTADSAAAPADSAVAPADSTAAPTGIPFAPAASSPARAEKIPIEAFSATPFFGNPELSPAGDRVAARMNLKGQEVFGVLFITDKGRKPQLISGGKHDLLWYRWAGQDRLLMGVGMITRWEGIDVYITRLLCYDVLTGQTRFIGPKRESFDGDDVVHVAEDGSYALLSVARDVYSYPDVHRIDLTSGATTKILSQQSHISSWYADPAGTVRMGMGFFSGKLRIVYREREQDRFKTVAKMRLDEMDGDIDTVRFRTTGQQGYVVSNAQTGRFSLYEFDWKTFEFGKPIFEHPSVDLDDFSLTEDGEHVAAVYYTDDRERIEWLDPQMKQLQAGLDRLLPDRINWVVSSSRDRQRLLVWSGAADDPGHYFFYDRPAKRLEELATPYEKLEHRQLAPVKAVSYRAHDGLQIPAYLTLPVGRGEKNLPLILMPHGGPHIRDTWAYDAWVQFLANRGYAVLQPNFRGSAGYGKEYLAKGFGQWGAGMQDDLTDGVQWLVQEGIADPKRVCIMGASYGGYAAIMGAIRTPQLFRCAISFAGVTDVNDMMRYDRHQMLPSRYKRWRERVRGAAQVDLTSVSPVSRAAEVAAPLLLMHGTDDGNVPYRQAERFVKAMTKADRPFEFVEFKDVGHGLATESDRARFFTAVDAFLAKHNPAD